MKKALLFVSAAALAITASAAGPWNLKLDENTWKKPVKGLSNENKMNVASRAEGDASSIFYTPYYYQGDPYSSCFTDDLTGYYVYQGFEWTTEQQQKYIGNSITEVNVVGGVSKYQGYPNLVTSVDVFVTDDCTKLPEFTTGSVPSQRFSTASIKLDNPVEITGEKNLYIGYRFKFSSDFMYSGDCVMYYLVFDGDLTEKTDNAYLINVVKSETDAPNFYNTQYAQWMNYSDQLGHLCVSATVSGDKLPVNMGSMKYMEIPLWTKSEDLVKYNVGIRNDGANDITAIQVKTSATNGVEETQTYNLATPIAPKSLNEVEISVPNPQPGVFNLTTSLVSVNEVNVENGQSFEEQFTTYTDGYTRNLIVEEFTGTWCGWCPRGIVMMEYLKEAYPDIIRVAYHYNDSMQNSSFLQFIKDYASGFPGGVLNRMYDASPQGKDISNFLPYINYLNSFPAYAKLDLSAEMSSNGKNVVVSTNTNFAFNTDVEHKLAFVLVEDGVGPYKQTNYYAADYGMGLSMDGWEKKAASVETVYEDVARYMKSYPGIAGSLPENIEKDANIEGTYPMPVSTIKGDAFRIIGLIINATNGYVVNAVELPMSKTAAVEGIETEGEFENGVVEVYSLDGRRVNADNLSNGIYIMKANGKTKKVLVK